jgi:predicted RNA-binding protein
MFAVPKDSTRIDLERTGRDLYVSIWFGEWSEGSQPAIRDFVPQASIERVLFECEKHGFSVEMMDAFHGRALRGKVTRIDLIQQDGKWLVSKYPYGWTAKTRPISKSELDQQAADQALAWLKAEGWTVREFPGGARAWRGEVKPIRDQATIRMLRRQIDLNYSRSELDARRQYDLAFDC